MTAIIDVPSASGVAAALVAVTVVVLLVEREILAHVDGARPRAVARTIAAVALPLSITLAIVVAGRLTELM